MSIRKFAWHLIRNIVIAVLIGSLYVGLNLLLRIMGLSLSSNELMSWMLLTGLGMWFVYLTMVRYQDMMVKRLMALVVLGFLAFLKATVDAVMNPWDFLESYLVCGTLLIVISLYLIGMNAQRKKTPKRYMLYQYVTLFVIEWALLNSTYLWIIYTASV